METSLQSQYRRDGVTFLPEALDAGTVRAAEDAWAWSLENPGRFPTRLLPDRMERVASPEEARIQTANEPGSTYQELIAGQSLDVYHVVAKSNPVKNILRQLFSGSDGRAEAWLLGAQVFLKEGEQPGTGWHQDVSDMRLEGQNLVALWMSFEPLPADASLEVVRGSHLGPVYSSYYGSFRAEPIPDVEGKRSAFDIVSWAYAPGDVVAFHPAALHGGGATAAAGRRRSLALRFMGLDCRRAPGHGDGPVKSIDRSGLLQVL